MELSERVADLERRVATLEGGPRPTDPLAAGDDALWALDALVARIEPPGAVVLAGAVSTPDGRAARWQETQEVAALLDGGAEAVAETLAALGSPIRLRLLLQVLRGAQTVQELTAVEGVGTSGQVYHHLRQLTAAGWVRPIGSGRHEVPVARVVPLLAALLIGRRGP